MNSSGYVRRSVRVKETLKRKSVLLLGPRRTGKSALIRHEIEADGSYNLLNSVTFRNLATHPSLIRESLKTNDRLIVIDEIQKLPNLLDEVHLMIEEMGIRFLLTGSSARKLRRSYTSLMAGRASRCSLFPLTGHELGPQFNLERALLYGTLPGIYLSEDPRDELRSYVGDYLKEEVMAEALSRNIESFARFLQTAAVSNGEILNFEKIGMDAQVPARTIREYYSVLEDTLIGTSVHPYRTKQNRKSISKSKFFFFDLGVLNSLLERKTISKKTAEFGNLFESFIFLELKAFLEYQKKDESLCFWRTQAGHEVDFILGDEVAIEVKSTALVNERHFDGLRALEQVSTMKRKIIVSGDETYRKIGDIEVMPYLLFIQRLWQGDIFR